MIYNMRLLEIHSNYLAVIVFAQILYVMIEVGAQHQKVWSDEEETVEFWNKKAQDDLALALQRNEFYDGVAQNVILFLGDGMGIPTITAGRILKGQLNGQLGEEYELSIDKFPNVGLSKTYSIDRQTTDSAATATAFLCGIKSTWGTLGLAGKARMGVCESATGQEVNSILIDAYNQGKSTGIVTTTHLVHATPAGAYAHTPERNWYSDAQLTQNAIDGGCTDIAKQFYENSHQITVALGGGRKYFRPNNMPDVGYPQHNGTRLDGRNFVEEWLGDAGSESRSFVWNKQQLEKVQPDSTDRLWGMFQPSHMNFEIDRNSTNEPSISEMVEKAIQILGKNPNGYFLLVEGGRIDHGHHDSSAIEVLHDMVAFDDAVDKATEMTTELDTLIVVTADHSHTMSLGGYALRGTSVFGLADQIEVEMIDTKPATSILYGDGPGYLGEGTLNVVQINPNEKFERENITLVDTAGRTYRQQSAVPRTSESHAGDDVPIYARGPMAHLFHGVHEQNYIAHVMRYASCLDADKAHCAPKTDGTGPYVHFLSLNLTKLQARFALYFMFALLICSALVLIFLTYLFLARKFRNRK
uniref:alkaline phosphatase-like isoform X1 n=1 Tax=Styela clava TaxID=7725 RepID=UPI001939A06F|nr:alkaline phosphatase-like isoform X1 [Styela clava]